MTHLPRIGIVFTHKSFIVSRKDTDKDNTIHPTGHTGHPILLFPFIGFILIYHYLKMKYKQPWNGSR